MTIPRGMPLDKYFFLETFENKAACSPFVANMYLAEDRIMGFELLARANCNYILQYVAKAVATTDVPQTLGNLLRQRRRWLNGSFFAALYAIENWHRVYTESGHATCRKAVRDGSCSPLAYRLHGVVRCCRFLSSCFSSTSS